MKIGAGLIYVISILLTITMVMCNNKAKEPVVLIETNYGNIKVKLYNETPLHRDNFIKLAKEGAVSGFIFHRVVKEFMIQAGEYPPQNNSVTIPAEIEGVYPHYYHKRGALAAAHWDIDRNPEKASESKQFYIVTGRKYLGYEIEGLEKTGKKPYTQEQKEVYRNEGGTPHLDGEYTVFGEVIEGMEIVDKIESSPTNSTDRPLHDITITKLSVVSE